MGITRKIVKIELLFLVIDKSKGITDVDYLNILVDNVNVVPFIFLQDDQKTLDKNVEALYNEYTSLDFAWATKFLAEAVLDGEFLVLRYIIRIPKINNIFIKGKLISSYDFLNRVENEHYDRIISG